MDLVAEAQAIKTILETADLDGVNVVHWTPTLSVQPWSLVVTPPRSGTWGDFADGPYCEPNVRWAVDVVASSADWLNAMTWIGNRISDLVALDALNVVSWESPVQVALDQTDALVVSVMLAPILPA